MKKQLLGFAACALILSSCSQNQEIENYEQMNREEVRLAPYVNKTKASVTDLDAMKAEGYSGFKVFALQHTPLKNGQNLIDGGILSNYSVGTYDFMTNLIETYKGTLWTHGSTKYYWPETDALSFFAVAPAEADIAIEKGISMTLPIVIYDEVSAQKDILAASVLNKTKATVTSSNGQVDFTFKHILSRIGFAAKVKDGENLKFKITGISFDYGADIVKNGVFTFTAEGIGTMAPGQTKHVNNAETPNTSHGIEFNALPGASDGTIVATNKFVPINADDSYLMLIPQNKTGNLMTMTLNYQVAVAGDAYDGENPKKATIAIPAMKYEQGKAYTYNLILSSKSGDGEDDFLEVTFGVTDVAPWGDPSEENVEVPKPTTPQP